MPALAFDFNERGELAPPAPPLMPTASRALMRRVVEAVAPAPHHHPAPLPAPLAQPPRAADLMLSQRGAGFARRHRDHLERKRLARLERWRHRHLLGACALDRRSR